MAAARHRADRPPGRQSLSVCATVARARQQLRRGDREHRHRRPGDAARRGEEPRARRGRRRSGRLSRSCCTSSTREHGGSDVRHARAPGRQGLHAHRAVRHAGRRLSGAAAAARRKRSRPRCRSCSSACRRCATARTRISARLSTASLRRRRRERGERARAAGQGPVLQQHRRCGCGHRVRAAVRDAACVIVKHANPCGARHAATLLAAYEGAYRTDPASAFGGIIAFNRELDAATAAAIIARQFVEVLAAPAVHADAARCSTGKPNVRVLGARRAAHPRRASSSNTAASAAACSRSTRSSPTGRARDAHRTHAPPADARRTRGSAASPGASAKFVKSNAIVFARDAGDPRDRRGTDEPRPCDAHRRHEGGRCEARAGRRGARIGCVPAVSRQSRRRRRLRHPRSRSSRAARMRDGEVIEAADEHGIAMVFTGMRHFRH